MTFVPTTAATTAGGTAAAAAAARRRREMQREEEQMTGYSKEDVEGWEFKIVRSATRKFRKREIVRQLCAEEAKAGWEMLEKFDDRRIRFKRRVDQRAGDAHLRTDPYRTQFGIGEDTLGFTIAVAILLGLGVVALIAFLVFGLNG
jgi:hypothetical protein